MLVRGFPRELPHACARGFFEPLPAGAAPFAAFGSFSVQREAFAIYGRVPDKLRAVARAAGLPDAAKFCTKSFRRGRAETLRRGTGRLCDILRAGDWNSSAFQLYLEQSSLEGDAMAEAILAEAAQQPLASRG